MKGKFTVGLISFLVCLGTFIFITPPKEQNIITQPPLSIQIPITPSKYEISTTIPSYLNYHEVKAQLNKWHDEAPDITEIGSYGQSSKGNDLFFLRLCANKKSALPKVLITACIHGNEKIANATVMGIIGKMLYDYGRDSRITKLVKERDIYWIPIVSPDSYIADSRYVDGVDPNRNFPYPQHLQVDSVQPIAALRKFFLQHKFNAVISGHAFGGVYLYPWGYTYSPCQDSKVFGDITGRMAELSGYRAIQCRKVPTAMPMRGFEVDWFYMNGAFAIVCEFAKAFHPPSSTIAPEVNRNYPAFLLFIDEASLALGGITNKANNLDSSTCSTSGSIIKFQ